MSSDPQEVIEESDVIVVSKPSEFQAALSTHAGGKLLYDLARVSLNGAAGPVRYEGFCW